MKDYKSNPNKYKGNVADISNLIRVILTTKDQTPDLYQIIQILGEEKTKERVKKAI